MTIETLKSKAAVALNMYEAVPTCSEGKNNAEYEEEMSLKHKAESIALKIYGKLYDKLVEPPTRQKKMVVFLVEERQEARNTRKQLDRVEFCFENNWMRHWRFVFRPAQKGKTTQRMRRQKFLEGVDFSPGNLSRGASFVLSGGD